MKLTPLDVKKQEFRKTFRGFDPIEVQTFLEMVAEEYEQVLDENKQLDRRLIELETKLKDYQVTEKNLRETLLNVQEVKKQSEESSRRQADLIIKESELKALEIIEMARKQARQMRDEVNILRSQKESFINRLRQILISQIELLSVLEIDDAVPQEAHRFMENVKIRKKSALKNGTEQLKEQLNIKANKADVGPADIKLAEEMKKKDVVLETADNKKPVNTVSESIKIKAENVENTGAVLKNLPAKNAAKANKLAEEDINDFFKKGIQIDELIKNLDKKQQK